ncbi:cytochrome c oxidase subunit 3 [Aromatoleum toluclasticum]|uniref:cytochrome c oxidase subunit 3 n=1 Tax=Aromatoleum toluclasticum TaxID=92003 RepID=UPI000372FEDF|nr:cytochrome c oxidase subunit 3 [Aromatoleum toluclasticum]
MSLLAALAVKPWLPQPPDPGRAAPRAPAAAVGLRVLLGVIAMLFALFAIALLVRARLPDWQALPWPATLWLNTGLLAASSVALQFASGSARHGRERGLRGALAAAAALALGFLAGQGWVWAQFVAAGHFVASHPAASFFYLLTGLHGLHLAGGLVALGWAAAGLAREGPGERSARRVALCATYWHFLFAVWLVLFALLASSPGTLVALGSAVGMHSH